MIWIVILIVIVLGIIFLYNYLVRLNIRCQNAWSQIDNQLKRRADLIPYLVEVTKGYAKHESEVLTNIAKIRSESTMSQMALQSEKVSNSLNNLLAVAEGYPDLKANEVFKNLQIELTGTEDKIAFARQFYNDTVQHYNSAIMMFPSNIMAKILKYTEKEYFKVSEADKKEVKVEL